MAISHKRDTDARRFPLTKPKAAFVAAPLALVATLSTVGMGVWAADSDTGDMLLSSNQAAISQAGETTDSDAVDVSERPQVVSRSAERIVPEEPWEDLLEKPAVAKAIKQADTKLWTTAPLNLWVTPGEDAAKKGVLEESKKVLVTGREAAGRVEVVLDGEARWVTSGYLTDENPNAVSADGSSEGGAPALGGSCTNGTAVDGQPNIIAVHEAVCAAFPEITTYGTYRSDGEHSQGLAIDIMVSGSRGWEVAEFVRANYSALGVNYVMYSQKIWSVDRSAEGWRYVEDRGSVTANHYDHVHVTTY